MAKVIRERYERHHAEGERYGYSFGGAARIDFFRRALRGAGVMLDLGCRDGTLIQRLGRLDAKYIGLDIDRSALARFPRSEGRAVALADLWSGIPVRSGSVDAVLAGEFLEHCPDPWFVAREVERVLRSGGVFVGSVPNASRLKNRIRFLLGASIEIDRTHLHSFSAATLRACLSEARFTSSIEFAESRLIRVAPSLAANTLLFRATK